MKCLGCGNDAPLKDYRYLYNARIDDSISMRQCTNCQKWLTVDELKGVAIKLAVAGEDPWGKSAGYEGVVKH